MFFFYITVFSIRRAEKFYKDQEEKQITLEKLKKLLESEAITQDEFDELSKNIKEEQASEPMPEPASENVDYDKIDKLIQSKVDKQMAAERRKNAELEKKLKNLQQAKLTDEELKKIELEEKENAIAEREKAIADKENRLFAVKAIKEAGLDDGSDTSLSLIDFVMGADEAEIQAKIKSFKELFDKAVNAKVNAEVEKRFSNGAYTPKKGSDINNAANPYTKEQFNLTQQMQIEINNPELAAQLKAEAGVK